MIVELHRSSVLERPAVFDGAACVKVFNDRRQLVTVVLEVGGTLLSVSAGDADFESICAQYGIRTSPVDVLKQ